MQIEHRPHELLRAAGRSGQGQALPVHFRDEWGDGFKPGVPVFVLVIEDVLDGPAVADGTTDFCSEDGPVEEVGVVGATKEGTDLFGEGSEVSRG